MMLVHAANVRGQGALEVAAALLEGAAAAGVFQADDKFIVSRPLSVKAANVLAGRDVRVSSRTGAQALLARTAEVLAPFTPPPGVEKIFVLGDIPLRCARPQVILFHAPNLLPPAANPATRTDAGARLARWLLRRNARRGTRWVVQSEVFRDMLERGYPETAGRIAVVPQPAPAACARFAPQRAAGRRFPSRATLTLFYPAAGYPHKNHALLVRFAREFAAHWGAGLRIEVTLPGPPWEALRAPPPLENLGRLGLEDCYRRLADVDALVFPSLTESFGLPLIEAMTLGVPVLCADLPYARWACGEQAIYFDPRDATGLQRAVLELRTRLTAGWQPDWTDALRKFPRDWSQVAEAFFGALGRTG